MDLAVTTSVDGVFAPKLDRTTTESLREQIRRHLAGLIESRKLPPGAPLPPVRALAAVLGVNPMTVAKAYRELAVAGLVEGRGRSGTRVRTARSSPASSHRGLLRDRHARVSTSERLFELARAPNVIALTGNYPRPEDSGAPEFQACMAELVSGALATNYFRYDPPAGRRELQESVSGFVASSGIVCPPGRVIITAGGQQAIDLVLRSVGQRGGGVVVERPAYFGMLNAVRSAALRAYEVPVGPAGMDLDILESVLEQQRPRLICVNPTFHNPTGTTMPLENRRRLLSLARQHGALILEDDHCPELRFDGEQVPALAALEGAADLVFYARGFGKAFVPGVRLGFLLVPVSHLRPLLATKAAADLQSTALMQGALARFFARGHHRTATDRLLAAYAPRREQLLRALADCLPQAMRVHESAGGLSLWLTMDRAAPTSELYYCAASHGVAFASGEAFYARPPAELALRISFGLTPPKQMAEAAERLGNSLRDLLERGIAPPLPV
ncbi:MAG TPA: PLP-dependent aminotransferase family protein [Xanthobacteraceae bacterium]|nr:PLP-dependent aminotransferase family protein [Xanthobacteraceae bacterium]